MPFGPLGRIALSLASPGARRGRLIVLTYHRVLAEPDRLLDSEPDAEMFEAHVKALANSFNVLPLARAVEQAVAGALPPRAVCITFDDGYANNHSVALPILQSYALPATFFVTPAFLDGGRMWNDTVIEIVRRVDAAELDLTEIGLPRWPVATLEQRRRAAMEIIGALKHLPFGQRQARVQQMEEMGRVDLPDDLMMTSDQVRALQSAGMEIGAHTMRHPILSRLPDEEARAEIEDSCRWIERLQGIRPRCFAYPNGRPGRDYDDTHVAMVRRAGFDVAVTTQWGYARRGSDPLQIPRIGPWDRTAARFTLRLLRTYMSA